MRIFDKYYQELSQLQEKGVRLPFVPDDCSFNAHVFYLICESEKQRDDLIAYLKGNNIVSVFHYLPLHLSPMGKKYGGQNANCKVTVDLSSRLVRLPLFHELTDQEQGEVIGWVLEFFKKD